MWSLWVFSPRGRTWHKWERGEWGLTGRRCWIIVRVGQVCEASSSVTDWGALNLTQAFLALDPAPVNMALASSQWLRIFKKPTWPCPSLVKTTTCFLWPHYPHLLPTLAPSSCHSGPLFALKAKPYSAFSRTTYNSACIWVHTHFHPAVWSHVSQDPCSFGELQLIKYSPKVVFKSLSACHFSGFQIVICNCNRGVLTYLLKIQWLVFGTLEETASLGGYEKHLLGQRDNATGSPGMDWC